MDGNIWERYQIFFISPWLDAMKSIFIANLSTPQNTPRDTQASSTWIERINHSPIAPIQFKSENNTHWDSNWGFSLRFKYQNYDTFLWRRRICFSGKKWINFIVAFGLKDEKKWENLWKIRALREGGHFYVCPIASMKNYFPPHWILLISLVRDKEKSSMQKEKGVTFITL